MPSPTNQAPEPKFLNSWKEIANYMGRGVRTVQRYEAQFGLPVRRPAGKSRGSVVATRAEVDAWVAASSIRKTLELSPQNHPDLLAIRKGLQEMQLLREQMAALRAQTEVSLSLLITGLRELRRTSLARSQDSNEILDAALHVSELHTFVKVHNREM